MFAGEPTVLQIRIRYDRLDLVLFDGGPIRLIAKGDKAFQNPNIWVLCDSMPDGIAQKDNSNQWFSVVAASPDSDDYERMLNSIWRLGLWKSWYR